LQIERDAVIAEQRAQAAHVAEERRAIPEARGRGSVLLRFGGIVRWIRSVGIARSAGSGLGRGERSRLRMSRRGCGTGHAKQENRRRRDMRSMNSACDHEGLPAERNSADSMRTHFGKASVIFPPSTPLHGIGGGASGTASPKRDGAPSPSPQVRNTLKRAWWVIVVARIRQGLPTKTYGASRPKTRMRTQTH